MANTNEINELQGQKQDWEKENWEAFKKERKKEFISTDGIPINRVYTPLDLKGQDFNYTQKSGFPGKYPFTRGIDPSMYRTAFYEVGQVVGASTPEESNQLFKKMLASGNDRIHIAYSLHSGKSFDSDNPAVKADVGKTGVTIDSLEDAEIMWKGIDLSKVFCLHAQSHALGIIFFAMHLAVGEKQGHSPAEIRGCLQNDVLKGYSVLGYNTFPVECAMRIATDVAVYCSANMPKYWPYEVSIYDYGEAGGNRIQQVAYGLSSAVSYLRAAIKRGVEIDALAPNILFLGYSNHRDILAEIAKTRAARRLWARIMREDFGAKNPESWKFRCHGVNGGVDMTRAPLELNIARIAIAALGIALSGVQSTGGATYDEALGIPSARASATAAKIRQLVAHETGVSETVDPLVLLR